MPMQHIHERASSTTPILDTEEEIHHTEAGTKFMYGDLSEGVGILFLTDKHVIWLSTDDPAKGVSFDYPFIALHAISRDPASFPEPCLYCQLAVTGEEVPEMRFCPTHIENLQLMFDVFSDMAALNPDENESDSENTDDDAEDDMWIAPNNDAAMEDCDDQQPNGVM